MNTRRRTASAELEGKILDAALELLSEQGVEALTVRGIATRACVAPMGIYNHFEGKNGVYEALWIDGFDRLTLSMQTAAPARTPREDIISCGQRYRTFALSHPAHYRLMFMEDKCDFSPSPDAAAASGRALQILVNRVESAQNAGEFPLEPAIDIAQAVWATVHGYVALELLRVNFASNPDAAYTALLEAVYDGFRAKKILSER